MEYVFHATINTRIDQAYLEFYKRHKDGTPISSEPERQCLIQCLQAAVERRSCEGVRLELSTEDRQGLLAEVIGTFRENELNVTRADIASTGYLAANTFYVTDAIGYLQGLHTGLLIDSGDGVTHVVKERDMSRRNDGNEITWIREKNWVFVLLICNGNTLS
ncbi:ACT domain-containing protein ACR8 [Trifolium repens]|nr:ACT domain-containing protein ACR8 [Trifolium repens]